MSFDFLRKFIEREKMSWSVAVFYSFFSTRMLESVYSKISNDLPLENEGFLIDIGTGPGNLAKLISEKYSNLKVVGIDLSGKMIKIAKKKEKPLGNLEFKTMDANNLEFAENSADFVISTLTMHHWQNPLRVFNEIYRVLKPGGKCWIYDGCRDILKEDLVKSLNRPFGLKMPAFFLKKFFNWHGFSTKDYHSQVKSFIEKNGFKKVEFVQESILMKIKIEKPYEVRS